MCLKLIYIPSNLSYFITLLRFVYNFLNNTSTELLFTQPTNANQFTSRTLPRKGNPKLCIKLTGIRWSNEKNSKDISEMVGNEGSTNTVIIGGLMYVVEKKSFL